MSLLLLVIKIMDWISYKMENHEDEFDIYDISHVESDSLEQLGTKSKFWYFSDGQYFLFKSIESKNGARLGDDWAEKISCELAKLLDLPHAHYELASYKGMRGVITPNFITQRGEQLVLGNQLLENFIFSEIDGNPNIQYVDDVHEIMSNIVINKPIGFSSLKDIKSASDFFVGYLMFDALISNQDRHNENWGTIVTLKGAGHLAPSYDHGASLARNISDDQREQRLTSKDKGQHIDRFVLKSKSWFLNRETNSRMKSLDAFKQYALMEKVASRSWLEILENLDEDQVYRIISRVPNSLMSKISKDFTFKLI